MEITNAMATVYILQCSYGAVYVTKISSIVRIIKIYVQHITILCYTNLPSLMNQTKIIHSLSLLSFLYESPQTERWLMSEFLNLCKLQLKILGSNITYSNHTTSSG